MTLIKRLFFLTLFSVSLIGPLNAAEFDNFESAVSELPQTDFKTLPALLEGIAELDDPRVSALLIHLSDGEVYFQKSDKKVFYVVDQADGSARIFDVLSGNEVADIDKKQLNKVKTNNSIRRGIGQLQAQLNINHPDPDIRLTAAREMLADVSRMSDKRLQNRLDKESDVDVLEVLTLISALKQFTQEDTESQLAALDQLDSTLEPDVRQVLVTASLNTEDYAPEVQAKIKHTMATIDNQRNLYSYAENIFFGLSLGSVLLLAAIGLAITFGVMGVINMAHGEMIMLGAYTTYVIQQWFPNIIEYSLLIAVPAAFIVSGTVGIIIERSVIQFLKGRPLETLLATFGVSLILQQLVRTVFSPLNRQVIAPEWMSGSWQINPVFSVTFNRLYIILFSLVVFFMLLIFLKKSALGLHVRAVAQNRDMARALSIRSNWVDAATFGLGSGIAGIAGVVLSQLTNVGPNLGQAYIIDSFLVVVFGGVGNLWGTLVSAMTLGVLNKFLEPLTGPVMASIIVLVGLVFFIQKRPMGLFPQKGRAVE
jgi:urea transport system permease protein